MSQTFFFTSSASRNAETTDWCIYGERNVCGECLSTTAVLFQNLFSNYLVTYLFFCGSAGKNRQRNMSVIVTLVSGWWSSNAHEEEKQLREHTRRMFSWGRHELAFSQMFLLQCVLNVLDVTQSRRAHVQQLAAKCGPEANISSRISDGTELQWMVRSHMELLTSTRTNTLVLQDIMPYPAHCPQTTPTNLLTPTLT